MVMENIQLLKDPDVVKRIIAKVTADITEREEKWWAFIKRTDKWEKAFTSELQDLFKKQFAEAMSSLRAGKPPKSLLNERKWRKIFQKVGAPLFFGTLAESGNSAMRQVPKKGDDPFDMRNSEVLKWLKAKNFQFAFEVNKTTTKALRKSLEHGLIEGEGIPQLARRVNDIFTFSQRYRSVRIARTEVIGASNKGTLEGFKQTGVVKKKEWLATIDDVTRDEHIDLDGVEVPVDSPFPNGLMHPGDPSGDGGDIINCRCTMLPVV